MNGVSASDRLSEVLDSEDQLRERIAALRAGTLEYDAAQGPRPIASVLAGTITDALYRGASDSIIVLLLDEGAALHTFLVQLAAEQGRTAIVRTLLVRRTPIRDGSMHAITAAATPEIAELLIERGADVSIGLAAFAALDEPDLVALMLRHGARTGPSEVCTVQMSEAMRAIPKVDFTGSVKAYAPMHVAACWGRASVVERLLDGGADPLVRGYHGLQPAHLAAGNGHATVLAALLGRGVPVTEQSGAGTPLEIARFVAPRLRNVPDADPVAALRLLEEHAQPS